jgi:hypothetical protein
MKQLRIVLATVAAVSVTGFGTPGPAEARGYWHSRGCGYAPYRDYSLGSVQSPLTYIYPSANWGPFFHCYPHYGPILILNAAP